MSDDYAELKAQIFAAREIIGHLCAEGRPPRMSIPANRYTDEDMVMDAALAAADKAIDTLRAENGRLRQDAERYRWLTTRAGAFPALVRFIAANSGRVDTGFSTPGSVLQAQSISDAIDAARAHLEGRVSDE